jgi:hypothetical protein
LVSTVASRAAPTALEANEPHPMASLDVQRRWRLDRREPEKNVGMDKL